MATEKSLQILEQIKSLTILELSDLVKAVEEEFGVSAAAPVAVAGAAGAAGAAKAFSGSNPTQSNKLINILTNVFRFTIFVSSLL